MFDSWHAEVRTSPAELSHAVSDFENPEEIYFQELQQQSAASAVAAQIPALVHAGDSLSALSLCWPINPVNIIDVKSLNEGIELHA